MSRDLKIDVPCKEYYILVQLDVAMDILDYCRDYAAGTLYDDLELVSSLDKARLLCNTVSRAMSLKLRENHDGQHL